jgi:hypothetical protein
MMKSSNNEKPHKIEDALINEIKGDNIKEVFSEGAELALDHFLDEGILKDIPFFGMLYKGYKAASSIREAIFAKKVYKFLVQLKDIPKDKRENFLKQLEDNKTHQHRVGEKLLIIIDQLDDMEKPEIIGRLLKSAIKGKINYEDFLRYSSIVQRLIVPDLLLLKEKYPSKWDYSKSTGEYFATLGIMSMKIEERKVSRIDGLIKGREFMPIIKYEINEKGRDLVKYGLLEDRDEEV